MTTLTTLEMDILDLSIEDHYGLWEVLWLVEKETGKNRPDALLLARELVERLLNERLIVLLQQDALTSAFNALHSGYAILEKPESWESGSPFFISATSEGESLRKRHIQ